jgi:hypothetical protein
MLKRKLNKKALTGILIITAVVAGLALVWWYWPKPSAIWEKTFDLTKTAEHTYALRVSFAKPIYSPIVPNAIEGTVEVLRDGVSLADLTADPAGKTGVRFPSITYIEGYRKPDALLEAAGVGA